MAKKRRVGRRRFLGGLGAACVGATVGCADTGRPTGPGDAGPSETAPPAADAAADGGASGDASDGGPSDATRVADAAVDAEPDAEVDPGPLPPGSPVFGIGVASGDPLHDRVILWTRLVMADGTAPYTEPREVAWEVAEDVRFARIAARGTTSAEAARGHAVHVDATGLRPDRWYYYRFRTGDEWSPVGRTRTAPHPMAPVSRLRVAVASCQDFRDGYYTAHGDIAAMSPDLVAFVGDYIYEKAGSEVRAHRTGVAADLDGYRDRYAQYRADPLLQEAHAACPWIVTWDDHEVKNDWGGEEFDSTAEREAFERRRAAALQAFYEHMPIRRPSGRTSLYRRLSWGTLVDFFVGDSRYFRDLSGTPRLLGDAQERWLTEGLTSATAIHKLFVQSVVFTDLSYGGLFVHEDQWDGFRRERQRILDAVAGMSGFGVLSGDRHAGLLAQLHRDPRRASSEVVGYEVSSNSISSDGLPDAVDILFKESWADIDVVEYAQARHRGYALMDIDTDGVDLTYRVCESVLEPGQPMRDDANYRIDARTAAISSR